MNSSCWKRKKLLNATSHSNKNSSQNNSQACINRWANKHIKIKHGETTNHIVLSEFKRLIPAGSLLWLWLLMRLPARMCCRSNIWKIPVMHPICFCNSGSSSLNTCRNFADIPKSNNQDTTKTPKTFSSLDPKFCSFQHDPETCHSGNLVVVGTSKSTPLNSFLAAEAHKPHNQPTTSNEKTPLCAKSFFTASVKIQRHTQVIGHQFQVVCDSHPKPITVSKYYIPKSQKSEQMSKFQLSRPRERNKNNICPAPQSPPIMPKNTENPVWNC